MAPIRVIWQRARLMVNWEAIVMTGQLTSILKGTLVTPVVAWSKAKMCAECLEISKVPPIMQSIE